MLVASGQPVEIERFIQDNLGEPFDPTDMPTARVVVEVGLFPDVDGGTVGGQGSSDGGSGTVDGGGPGGSSQSCAVRRSDDGMYAARLPTSVLSSVARLRVDWSWKDDVGQDAVASDQVEVTSRAVCSLADVARLAGNKARDVSPLRKLRAISLATRAFESATNVLFSPRIAREVLPYPGPMPSLDDISGDHSVLVEPGVPALGMATYTYTTGRRTPPEDVSRAVAILATSIMADGPWDDRGMAVSDEAGTVRLLTAGVGRTMFSIPEVEATARRYRQPVFA